MFWAVCMRCCFCCSASTLGIDFAYPLHMHRSSIKIECTDPVLIATLWLTELLHNDLPWLFVKSSLNQLLISACGWPAWSASFSIEVWSCLKQLYHSSVWVLPIASLPKASWIFWMVWVWISPSLWQNIMQYLCSMHLVILCENKNLANVHYMFVL